MLSCSFILCSKANETDRAFATSLLLCGVGQRCMTDLGLLLPEPYSKVLYLVQYSKGDRFQAFKQSSDPLMLMITIFYKKPRSQEASAASACFSLFTFSSQITSRHLSKPKGRQ